MGLRLRASCSVRYRIRACSCSRVRELRSAAEVFANIAAVRLSCWSAIEGVISMSTIVGRDGVVVGGLVGFVFFFVGVHMFGIRWRFGGVCGNECWI